MSNEKLCVTVHCAAKIEIVLKLMLIDSRSSEKLYRVFIRNFDFKSTVKKNTGVDFVPREKKTTFDKK